MQSLNVTEIFYSFQGESSFMGKPTVFLRLAGCNLNCSICDTKYSFNICNTISIDEIINRLNAVSTPYLCITGGEPLLQIDELLIFIKKIEAKFLFISVETNGSLLVNKLEAKIKKIIDVKTPCTKQADSFNLENLKYITNNDELKFVISDKNDFDYSMNFLNKNNLWLSGINILFSPNLNIPNMANNLSKWILESKKNIQFQPQLHKLVKEAPLYL